MSIKNSTNSLKIAARERWLAFGVLCALVVGAVALVGVVARLQSSYSLNQFLPENHPLLKSDLETRERFLLDQTQPVLVTLSLTGNSGDWLETGRLQKLTKVTNELREFQGVVDIMGIGTVQLASSNNGELTVGPLVSVANEKDRRARVKKDQVLNPLLISSDARKTVIVVSVKDGLDSELLSGVMNGSRSKLAKQFPEATVAVGGVPAIQTQLASLVKGELVRFMGLALLACCLMLFAVFSSPWTVVVPFAAILLSNIYVLAFMSAMGIPMTVLAVTIPILVSVVVLSLCIHSMLRFNEDSHGWRPRIGSRWSLKAQLVGTTFRALLLTNFLTSLATCCGFATLALTDVPVIRGFGLSVAASVMISWACTTLVIGPLFALLPVPTVRTWVLREARWTKLVFRFRKTIVAGVALGSIVLAICGHRIHWSARLFDDLPTREEARRATEEIDRGLGGTIPFEVVITHAATTDPWNEPSAIKSLDRVLRRVRVYPEVGSAIGLPDLLRAAIGHPAAEIPASRAAIAENWLLLSMADNSPLKKFMTSDGQSTRLSLRLRDVAGDRLEAAMAKIEKYVQSVFPDSKVATAGMATTVHRLNNGLSQRLLIGFWEALGVITLLLFLVFRSVRWTLTAALPNLVPAAVLVGALAISETPMKPGVALVFSIALGLAFNNTVYLLHRLRTVMAESGRGPGEEIERTLRLEGNPCMIASFCLLAGFGTFLLSDFGINQTFGIYMLLSLLFGLVGDLFFLPALIHLWPSILNKKQKPTHWNKTLAEDQMAKNAQPENVFQPRTAATIVAVLMTLLLPATAAQAAQDATAILKNVEKGLLAKDERAVIKMKVVESNGSSKEREVEIKRKAGGKNQVLVRLRAPSDVSGVALLSVAQGSTEDQWLYMPSQKKARRVVSGNKSQRFLDTEFNYEDFSASTYARFENKVVSEERAPSAAVAIIESKSKGGDSSYSKIKTWVDLASYQVQKSEYYDKDGALLKTMVFRDYKKFGTAWRAQTVEVRNMQTRRSTILKIAALRLNSGLTDREFTQSALERED